VATCAAAVRIDSTFQEASDHCEDQCIGHYSECCSYTNFIGQVESARCINPSLDTCVSGHVCPLDFELCSHDFSHRSGPFFCFDPSTHQCVGNGRSDGTLLCKIGQVACGDSCMPEGEGECCGSSNSEKWIRSEEDKVCCFNRGRSSHDGWECPASSRCPTWQEREEGHQCIANPDVPAPAPAPVEPQCGTLEADGNAACRDAVSWAFAEGKHQSWAAEVYAEITTVAGEEYNSASLGDFQRLFFCNEVGGNAQCGSPPCHCTNPPCYVCP